MRLQLALNVADLDAAVDFYTRMFGVGPAKTRPGYANFAIADPPLKLVLFEGDGEPGTINHLGVETESAAEVVAAEARLAGAGLGTSGIDETQCCYAEKTETWVHGPDGARWEWYVKRADVEQRSNVVLASVPGSAGSGCCPGDSCG
ncbi:MAG: VOC family protein [Acidimicrobiia bacterium]|nr:VOC family protein [Acidimicrobiia bacterium]